MHNIVVRDGASTSSTCRSRPAPLRGLELGVPFLSTLPSQRKIKVEPHLAFVLDGSRFDSSAAPRRGPSAATARRVLDRFDVSRWLGYLPRGLPAHPKAAPLSADLRGLRAAACAVAEAQRQRRGGGDRGRRCGVAALLEVGSVKVAIDELRPLEQLVRLARIESRRRVLLRVNAGGRVNLLLAARRRRARRGGRARAVADDGGECGNGAGGGGASHGGRTGAASVPRGDRGVGFGRARAAPWPLTLAALGRRPAGQLDWRDATTAPAAALALSDFSLDAQAIAWPLDAPVRFKGGGILGNARNTAALDSRARATRPARPAADARRLAAGRRAALPARRARAGWSAR